MDLAALKEELAFQISNSKKREADLATVIKELAFQNHIP